MCKKITIALAGLGSRGKDAYAVTQKLFPEQMEIVAIADIDKEKVKEVAKCYGISEENCFSSAEEMMKEKKLADAMFITTQDRQHVKQAIRAMELGYDILLEKPISPDLDECREITSKAKILNKKVVVCHVLRYTPFYQEVKRIIDSGKIGEIVSVMGIENVGYWHQAHSFVRGNWRNSNETSPMILQKCCHDMDILLWLTKKTCKSVTSFGGTYLFKKENAPEGATMRCTGGCKAKEGCPFDAEKIYVTDKNRGVLSGYTGWPLDVLALHPTEESIREAIEEGPYGRCVYYCDNNVVDHQVINMEMTDGSTISFTMSGFTAENSRYTKFMGTKGQIIADMMKNTVSVIKFGEQEETTDISKLAKNLSGHAGGDSRLVKAFLDYVSSEETIEDDTITSLERSVESHYIALAAEKSRMNGGKVIYIDEVR